MRFVTLLALLVSLCSASLFAQATGTPSSKLTWDQGQVATAAEAQALTFKYYSDGVAAGVALTGVTCTGTTAPFACSAPFPAFTPGAHSLTLTASNSAGEGPKSSALSFTFVVLPAAPANLRIQ